MSNFSTSVLFESSSPYFTSKKGIFTILLSNSQILFVNSVACKLMNYNAEELCSMNLENLIHNSCKHKWSNLKRNFLQESSHLSPSNEKLFELITKNDDCLVVSLYLKKFESPEKCMVVVESIDRREALVSIDSNGKILSHDEEVAVLFQYDASELVGSNILILIPSLNFKKQSEFHCSNPLKQYVTGRTKNRDAFPVCLTVNLCKFNSEILQVVIWAYLNLSGLFVFNEKLLLKNCNHSGVKHLFGHSKKEILNMPIVGLIPTFWEDIKCQSYKKEECQNDLSGFTNESNFISKDKSECSSNVEGQCMERVNYLTNITAKSTTHFIRSCFDNNLDIESKSAFTTQFSQDSREKIGNEKNLKSKISCERKFQAHLQSPIDGRCNYEKDGTADINTFCDYFLASKVKFFGSGIHNDGAYFDIKYLVKKVILNNEVNYCIRVSLNFPKYIQSKNKLNNSDTPSLNSISLSSFITKDDNCSEEQIKSSDASMISQSDEILTAGEYSQHYTNIMGIGKGAFGYVKMAFRNSDGLLVVTKFIKKQKVNIGSWVYHSDLNMKIPLEISFLITLEHPNIVKVLDVFHNDFFVQLVMEKHGAGLDLFEFIDRGLNCDEKLKSYIFRQIVAAVHYLDSLGILHRDIKDENVIINEKFEVKLIDFGSSAFMPVDKSFSKFYGTVEYCSPEVLQGNRYRGPELEIWALGVTLYILTFGENPFYDVEDTIKGQFSIPVPISEELNDLLHKMLDKNVETRITIGKLVDNVWINQPVCLKNYKFEEVVRCYDNEAHPPKYVSELHLDEYSNTEVDGEEYTEINDSENSLQNRDWDTLSDSDDKYCANHKLELGALGRTASPFFISSTPVRKNDCRLCKSASGLRKRTDHILRSYDFSKGTSNLNTSKLKDFNNSAPNLMEPIRVRNESLMAWDEGNSEPQVYLPNKWEFDESASVRKKNSLESVNNFTASQEESCGENLDAYVNFLLLK